MRKINYNTYSERCVVCKCKLCSGLPNAKYWHGKRLWLAVKMRFRTQKKTTANQNYKGEEELAEPP